MVSRATVGRICVPFLSTLFVQIVTCELFWYRSLQPFFEVNEVNSGYSLQPLAVELTHDIVRNFFFRTEMFCHKQENASNCTFKKIITKKKVLAILNSKEIVYLLQCATHTMVL